MKVFSALPKAEKPNDKWVHATFLEKIKFRHKRKDGRAAWKAMWGSRLGDGAEGGGGGGKRPWNAPQSGRLARRWEASKKDVISFYFQYTDARGIQEMATFDILNRQWTELYSCTVYRLQVCTINVKY